MPKHTAGEPKNFAPIPPDEYAGHVGEIRVSQHRSGNEQWDVPFVIDEGKYAGRMLWETLIFGLEQVGWKIDQFVAATLGVQAPGTEVDMEAENFQELPCRVRTKQEQYQGETKDRIKTWIAIKSEADQKADGAKSETKPAEPAPAQPATVPAASGKGDRF